MDLKEIPFEKADYCVFDFETTGTSPSLDKVIEIGIVKISKGKIIDTFQSFINPGRPVPYFITLMTGITNSDVSNAPYFEEVYYKIKEFVGDSILVAHHLNFDYSFLRNECANANLEMLNNYTVCTLKLAKRLFPELPSKSLGSLTRHFKIRHKNIHRGLGDALATAKIFLKMFPYLRNDHNADTVADIINFQNIPASKPFKIIKKKLASDYASIPDSPGVYFFKNSKDEIIYIGKAKSLKQRISNYFLNNVPRKTKEIIRKAHRIDFQKTNTELTALLAEAELIKKYKPNLNTLLKRYSNNYFIRITNNHEYPKVEVVSTFDFDGNDYYGPYPNRDIANSIKEIIDKTFLLRECTDKDFNKKKKCYLSEIERCLAPCVYDIKDKYENELNLVNDFLSGHNQSAIDRLLRKMKQYSEQKKYEEAAATRDTINSILNQLHKASILSEPINKAKVLIEIAGTKHNDYILMLEGKLYIRNFIIDEKSLFDEKLEDYFEGTKNLFDEVTPADLEKMKISLSWLSKNRQRIKIHYLSKYSGITELAKDLLFLYR
ncbi:exonuclease domain-containing protein [Rosettibacter firmus]|uniref:exonuclease domain-containing protein n=1 Tax=Rosettibacter firmus TaxID=3111522 RepID=UPI00336BD2A1